MKIAIFWASDAMPPVQQREPGPLTDPSSGQGPKAYPYASNAEGRKFLDSIPLKGADLEKFAHRNADRLLKLKTTEIDHKTQAVQRV